MPVYYGISPLSGKIMIHAPGRFLAAATNTEKKVTVSVYIDRKPVEEAFQNILLNNEYLRFAVFTGMVTKYKLGDRRIREMDKVERRGQIGKLNKKIQGYCIGMVKQMDAITTFVLDSLDDFELGSKMKKNRRDDSEDQGEYLAH